MYGFRVASEPHYHRWAGMLNLAFGNTYELGATGFEPATSCSQSTEGTDEKPIPNAANSDPITPEVTACTQACIDDCQRRIDAELGMILDEWPRIPEHVRRAIITLVESVRENKSAK